MEPDDQHESTAASSEMHDQGSHTGPNLPSAMDPGMQLNFDTAPAEEVYREATSIEYPDIELTSGLKEPVSVTLQNRFRDTLFQYKIWAPIIYIFISIYCFDTELDILDTKLLASLSLIFVLASITDYIRAKNASLLESQVAVITALAASLATSRQNLLRAETNYSSASTQLSALARKYAQLETKFTAAEQKATEDLTAFQKAREIMLQDYSNSLHEQIALHAKKRRQINDIRLKYFSALLAYQSELIDTLSSLTKKFKNVAVPKVKGVSPKKANSHTLTGPLEKLANSLREERSVTQRQLNVAEGVKKVLDREGLEKDEIEWAVGGAEGDLEIEVRNEGWEARMDGHVQRLGLWAEGMEDGGDDE